jgi:hypothetical protein
VRRPTRDLTLALIIVAVFVAILWFALTNPPGGV